MHLSHETQNHDTMRSYLYILVTLILVITFLSCKKSDEESEPIQKETPKITLNNKAAEIIEADKAFGFELFREVYTLSVSFALGMTYNGAAGTTLQSFNDVLNFGDLTTEEVNESYKDLMDQLINLDDRVEFSMANSIWYRLGFQVLSEFIKTNKDYFDADVKEIDFKDPQTVEVINQWIEDKTNDKIKDMLDFIPPNVVMYLINAIYFNAQWKYEFEKEDTYEGDFNLTDGTKDQADYMTVTGNFIYTSNEDFTAVELPYGDSTFSMVVMLPSSG